MYSESLTHKRKGYHLRKVASINTKLPESSSYQSENSTRASSNSFQTRKTSPFTNSNLNAPSVEQVSFKQNSLRTTPKHRKSLSMTEELKNPILLSKNIYNFLTETERNEINSYSEIYFIGKKSKTLKN